MAAGENWTWDETLMAFALYKLLGPSPKMTDPDLVSFANAIGRTPAAVGLKISNISAHDNNRIALGKAGLSHGGKFDKQIWTRYEEDGDHLLSEALSLLEALLRVNREHSRTLETYLIDFPIGEDQETLVLRRINQQYFRRVLLDNYCGACCITNLAVEPLLVASHIKPWSVANPKTERLAAANGLLLNALHDRAFDRGLITIDETFCVHVSPQIKRTDESMRWLWSFEGHEINIPKIHRPAQEFIQYHNELVFLH